jgi:CRISPR-associated protein Cmr6
MTLAEEYKTRRLPLQGLSSQEAPTANLGLWLEKFLETSHKAQEVKQEDQKKLINEARAKLIREAHELSLEQTNDEAYTIFYNRYRAALKATGAHLIEASTSGRMVVGLGNESLWENSITMHRAYGVPYIPGSALKGLCSSFAHRFLGNEWQKADAEDTGQAHRVIFGDTTSSGYVIFFDALPLPGTWALEREVMTVHHQDYYSGTEAKTENGNSDGKDQLPPADWDSPNPIPFISASGQFLLAIHAPDDQWRDKVLEILELALEREGVGAKTSSGYGRMRMLNSPRQQNQLAQAMQVKAKSQQESALKSLQTEFDVMKRDQLVGAIDGFVKRLEKLENNRTLAIHMLSRATSEKITKGKEDKNWFKILVSLAGQQ